MINALLRLERKRKGWTQQHLADFAQISRSTVERAEHGEAIRIDNIQRLCACLNKTPEQLGLLRVDSENDSNQKIEQESNLELTTGEDDVNRRKAISEMVKLGVSVFGTSFLATPQSFDILSKELTKPKSIDIAKLQQFKKITDACWNLSNGSDLESVDRLLTAYLPKIVDLTREASERQEEIASIASEGYLLASRVAGHQGNLNARYMYAEQALQYGQLATDPNLQLAALKQLAVTFDYGKRPFKALQTYQKALPLLGGTNAQFVSPLLKSRIYQGLAGTAAQCGKEEEALKYLDLAYTIFPDDPSSDPCFLYADSGHCTLLLWDGLTHLDLGNYAQALQAFSKVEKLPSEQVPERVRIEFLTYRAASALGLRDKEMCCIYLEQAVTSALALGSESRFNEAYDVYQQAQLIWPHEPSIKSLKTIFVR